MERVKALVRDMEEKDRAFNEQMDAEMESLRMKREQEEAAAAKETALAAEAGDKLTAAKEETEEVEDLEGGKHGGVTGDDSDDDTDTTQSEASSVSKAGILSSKSHPNGVPTYTKHIP